MNRLTTNITDQIDLSPINIASPLSVPAASLFTTAATTTAAVKRRKKILPKDFKGLGDYEQAALLVDSW